MYRRKLIDVNLKFELCEKNTGINFKPQLSKDTFIHPLIQIFTTIHERQKMWLSLKFISPPPVTKDALEPIKDFLLLNVIRKVNFLSFGLYILFCKIHFG